MENNNTLELIKKEGKYCAPNYQPLPVMLHKAEGVWVYDVENKKYLDMMSAYSAVSLGHSHPNIIQTLTEQAKTLCVTSRAFHVDTLEPFLAKLCALTGLDMALPMNSGAEAVETAIKAARRYGYQKKNIAPNKAEIIVAQNNFHGRTTTITSFSTEDDYKKDFGPFTPGFISIKYGDIDALKAAINPNTCAFLVEPMQGEAGIIMPPKGWLREVSTICKQNNVLLILDEIQTGLARTGKMFAFEHEDILPDGLILGKALGGGVLPVSAFIGRQDVMRLFTPGSHGSTFGGNALAAKVALAALNTLESENCVANSRVLGEKLLSGLKAIDCPLILDVRGKGLWVGVEVDSTKVSAYDICVKLLDYGILSKEAHGTVIRFAPPLIIDESTLDWAIARFAECINSFKY